MLSAIRDIGKWQIDKSGKNELDVLTKEPNFKNGGKVVFIKINFDDKRFEDVELEDYDSAKIHKYLFRGGVSQGPNPTPVAIINIKEPHKTFVGKIQKWFAKYSTDSAISDGDKDFLENINNILTYSQDQIVQAIDTIIADIPKKEGKLLTVKIRRGNEWYYIGEFEIFKKFLKEIKSKKIAGRSTFCSICGMQKDLSKDAGVFKFYTIDKPGFIAGGLNEANSWKNFPVCSQCRHELEEGRTFIEKNLAFKFYGFKGGYYLIPKVLLGGTDINTEILCILLDSKKIVSLKERVKKRITDDDHDILNLLADEGDFLTLNFLFLSKEQSAERILLLIEDVFPSRIKRIFEIKDSVDSVTGKNFTFGDVRKFFLKSDEKKRNNDLDKYFLDVVDKVFRGTVVDFSFLTGFYMTKIREDFANYDSPGKERYYFHSSIKSALMSTIFFHNLGLIIFEEMKNMEESKFESVFKKYGTTFATPVRRGLFLSGALTQMLLSKQGKERGAKPFMKKLKGLRMDERDIKALLPEVQNKFEEYDSFGKGKKLVAKEAYKYLFTAGDNWKLSVDEINFFFVGGMNLVEDIKDILYAEGEKDVDLEEEQKNKNKEE